MSAQLGGDPQQGANTCSLTPSYHSSVCKGTTGWTTAPVRKMLRAMGLAGLCPPSNMCPLARLYLLSVPHTSNAAKLPDYLVGRRRAAGRLHTLSLATRHITPAAKDQRPSFPPPVQW